MLAVAASARASATLLAEEATLSGSLARPVAGDARPGGYWWQNSRCCRPLLRPQHRYIGDLVSHPTDPVGRAGGVVVAQRVLLALHQVVVRLALVRTGGAGVAQEQVLVLVLRAGGCERRDEGSRWG